MGGIKGTSRLNNVNAPSQRYDPPNEPAISVRGCVMAPLESFVQQSEQHNCELHDLQMRLVNLKEKFVGPFPIEDRGNVENKPSGILERYGRSEESRRSLICDIRNLINDLEEIVGV